MAQWGKTNQAEDSPLWGPVTVKQAANATNRDELFENVVPDAFIDGKTVGVEADEDRGWVRKSEGSGGRAGRIQKEVLVAMSSIEALEEPVT